MELNLRQTDHLHGGIKKADQQVHVYEKIDKETDVEAAKLEAQLEKVLVQNSILEQLIVEEENKRHRSAQRGTFARPQLRYPTSDVISSSQNINPIHKNRHSFYPGIGSGASFGPSRPNVTRLLACGEG